MGDLLFTAYFDFETTTGDSVLNDPKMFVISYCQIYTFRPDLNLDKIVIFRSFQQNAEEIYSLHHFSQDHVRYFDVVTFNQMKDTATNVLIKQKSTSLSELFSVELKFTVDSLTKWFNDVFKSKFLELNEFQKQIFVKENPLDWSKTICSVCGFKLSTSVKKGPEKTLNLTTWYDFTVQQEHLFLRNIYSTEDLSKMDNLKTLEDFYEAFKFFLEVVVLLEKCGNRQMSLSDLDGVETLKRFFSRRFA